MATFIKSLVNKKEGFTFLTENSLDLSPNELNDFFSNRARIYDSEKILGIFSRTDIEKMLTKSGLMRELTRRNYMGLSVEYDLHLSSNQQIWIRSTSYKEPLVYLRIRRGSFALQNLPNELGELDLLFIDWLLIQDVKADLKKHKLFPGQKFPGLGIFLQLKSFLNHLVKEGKLDGAANVPAWFQDAVLFARTFKFLNPESQGFFTALLKQFKTLSLRELSWLLYEKKIISKNKEFNLINDFRYGEMAASNSIELSNYFNSKSYIDITRKTYEKAKFELKVSG